MIRLRVVANRRETIIWLAYALAMVAILALTWWAYRPGLTGAFLFDDLGSLPKLGATGPVNNWPTFWRYITSGSADPTGRPLALLSFLIDGHDWPTNPYPFKVTNVILHLINGALLAWVLWRLGRVLASPRALRGRLPPRTRESLPPSGRRGIEGDGFDAATPIPPALCADPLPAEGGTTTAWPAIAALFGAGAWLLHPLLVSTTLYIVQREAMLAATFALIGTLGWIASRRALVQGHVKRALVGMVLSAWICTLLAVLCKANGALLPLLLLLVEWIVLARQPMPDMSTRRWSQRAIAAFLITPSVLVVGYLLSMLPGLVRTTLNIRGWTVGQRLLTEPRVIADYLRLLFVPHARSSGLFNDAFAVSTGWMHPAATLPCMILVLALIGVGFALRKRHPAIALALLFYFAAQLMESGWLPLELYFEHRNYLPATLLFWPIGIGLARIRNVRWLAMVAAAAVLLLLGGLTRQRATLWGDAPHQAEVWAAINPDSARAQTSAALYDLQAGMPRVAAARLQLALPHHPDNLQIPVNLITAECQLGTVFPDTLTAARIALAHDRVGTEVVYNWFTNTLVTVGRNTCTGLTYKDMQRLLDAARSNPHWNQHAGLRANLDHLQGSLALAQHHPKRALQDFDNALAQHPEPATALNQAATLATAGFPRLGLEHLDYFETLAVPAQSGIGMTRIHAWVLQRQGWWPQQIAHLRHAMRTAAPSTTTGSTL